MSYYQVLPGSGEDKKVKLTAFEEPDGDIDGDIIETERTKPGEFIICNHASLSRSGEGTS